MELDEIFYAVRGRPSDAAFAGDTLVSTPGKFAAERGRSLPESLDNIMSGIGRQFGVAKRKTIANDERRVCWQSSDTVANRDRHAALN